MTAPVQLAIDIGETARELVSRTATENGWQLVASSDTEAVWTQSLKRVITVKFEGPDVTWAKFDYRRGGGALPGAAPAENKRNAVITWMTGFWKDWK